MVKDGQIMKHFDYSFLQNMRVPVRFMTFTNTIYALRNMEEEKKAIYPDIFTALQKLAIIQSVKGSNAIEGIVTTDKRIEEIVNQSSAPLNHNEQEIVGYRDVLNLIHTRHAEISLNEEVVLNFHRISTFENRFHRAACESFSGRQGTGGKLSGLVAGHSRFHCGTRGT